MPAPSPIRDPLTTAPVITSGIYCGGPLYSQGNGPIDDLRASGFTTVVGWCIHVNPSGDLNMDMPLVTGGEYVAGPGFAGLMNRLKESPTSVDRVLLSVGAWGTDDWAHIQQLVRAQGVGPETSLYRGFSALKAAIPAIDGIDFDDEQIYDPATTVPFAQMLHTIGYDVTFCPYTEQDFWVGCLKTLNTATPNLVTGFNLQCYAGGAGNSPAEWIDAIEAVMPPEFDAKGFVSPGLWCVHDDGNGGHCNEGRCPDDIASQLGDWRSTGIRGGWIWLLDDVLNCESSGKCTGAMSTAAYAQAIADGLGSGAAQGPSDAVPVKV
jgi:hypothetical protein